MERNCFKSIRARLGVTQAALAEALGVTQGNVSLYEKGQTVPPAVAARLIDFAGKRGHVLSFDDVYATLALSRDGRAAPGAEMPDPQSPASQPESSHAE